MTNISRLMPAIAEPLLFASSMSAAAGISDQPPFDHYRSHQINGVIAGRFHFGERL